MGAMVGEAFGLCEPDYRKLLFIVIVAYWVMVLIEIGIFSRGRNGR